MELNLVSRAKRAWNAFYTNRDPTPNKYVTIGPGSYRRPDRMRFNRGTAQSIVNPIYNRIALDAAAIEIRHVKTDSEGRYLEEVNSKLNNCLTLEANIDQSSRSFRHDIYLSLLDEGEIAIVPVDTYGDPTESNSYDIETMRTGKIVEWYPQHVKVELYNEQTGRREQITLPKKLVAIIENPLRSVVNEPNSTVQRLIRKLNLLDAIDEQSSSGKLDLIIQLPYAVKTDTKRAVAEKRKNDIVDQLENSKYGIAYVDATEKITQLNRPVENNLMKQIEYLTNLMFSQLTMTQSILDGTADEQTMLNYNNRLIEAFVSAVVDEFKRKFLTKTARTQLQTIMMFRDPFKLVPVGQIAEIADKFTRNEIATSNEIRQVIGWKPSKDPRADELRNKNLSEPKSGTQPQIETEETEEVKE